MLHDINVLFESPSLVALLGPNGSGKSTLLKLMGGLLCSKGESIQVDRLSLADLPAREAARWIAWVPQRADAVFAMSVREMVRVGRYRVERPMRAVPHEEEESVNVVLERVGLVDLADRDVTTLSGGEWQRALVARAVVQDAPIVLLDEPVASLDLRYQDEVYRLLRELASEGRLIIVADHHLEIAASYADRTLLLSGGVIVADGTAEEVMTTESISRVFDVHANVFKDPVSGSPRLSRPEGKG